MATYQFGVVGTLTTAYGLLQNFSVTNTATVNEAKDKDGETAYVSSNQEVLEASADLIFDTTQTAPGFGDTITTTGMYAGKYKLMSITETESNSDYRKMSVTLKKWVDNTLPSA